MVAVSLLLLLYWGCIWSFSVEGFSGFFVSKVVNEPNEINSFLVPSMGFKLRTLNSAAFMLRLHFKFSFCWALRLHSFFFFLCRFVRLCLVVIFPFRPLKFWISWCHSLFTLHGLHKNPIPHTKRRIRFITSFGILVLALNRGKSVYSY